MKKLHFLHSSLVAMLLVCLLAGSAFSGPPQEEQMNFRADKAIPAVEVDKTEQAPPRLIHSQPLVRSPREDALLNELKAARRAGDRGRAKEIRDLLTAGDARELPFSGSEVELIEVFVGSGNQSKPIVPSSNDPKGSSRNGNDVLVIDHNEREGRPNMVGTPAGMYYLVEENVDSGNHGIDIVRSFDGGETWSFFDSATNGSYDLKNPDIAVAEYNDDYVYIAYTIANNIQLLRIDLSNGDWLGSVIASDSTFVGYPRIVTDSIDYPGYYYLYVTYVSGPNNEIKTVVSTDHGETWERNRTHHTPSAGAAEPRPDIAWGDDALFVAWEQEVSGSIRDIFVSRSDDFGSSFNTPTNVSSASARDCCWPRIAGIHSSIEVAVVYEVEWSPTDLDVWFSYSTDLGSTWSGMHTLAASSSLDEISPVICASPSYGDFHVAYWQDGCDIFYTSAPHSNPMSWSDAELVSDTHEASSLYRPPTIAVDWASLGAGVAWSDFRGSASDYAIYFDRSDWMESSTFTLTIDPDPLRAHQYNSFLVTGANPNSPTYLAYSTNGPGSTYCYFLGVYIDLAYPKQAGRMMMTNSSGEGGWSLWAPYQGMQVWLQAVQNGQVSNVVNCVVQ